MTLDPVLTLAFIQEVVLGQEIGIWRRIDGVHADIGHYSSWPPCTPVSASLPQLALIKAPRSLWALQRAERKWPH